MTTTSHRLINIRVILPNSSKGSHSKKIRTDLYFGRLYYFTGCQGLIFPIRVLAASTVRFVRIFFEMLVNFTFFDTLIELRITYNRLLLFLTSKIKGIVNPYLPAPGQQFNPGDPYRGNTFSPGILNQGIDVGHRPG